MNTPRKVVLVTTVFGVALTGALVKSAFGSASASDAPQSTSTKMPLAGPDRPANVPDGYVITPFGYFHPSCVQSLARGERLMADGRLQHANGNVEEKAAVCNYPHFTRSGISSSAPEAKAPPEINGCQPVRALHSATPQATDKPSTGPSKECSRPITWLPATTSPRTGS